jgi:SAM-dependent methyltransferase
VTFHARDAADPALEGAFDLVTVFEAVHDMSQPAAVLGAARRLLAPGGTLIVMDERVAERFTARGTTSSGSCTASASCLPAELAGGDAVGRDRDRDAPRHAPGLRPGRRFGELSVLPIEHPSFVSTASTPEGCRPTCATIRLRAPGALPAPRLRRSP